MDRHVAALLAMTVDGSRAVMEQNWKLAMTNLEK